MLLHAIVLSTGLCFQPAEKNVLPAINACDSVVRPQIHQALDLLRSAEQRHQLETKGLIAVYEGSVSIEGHYMRPGMVQTVPIQMELTVDASGHVIVMRETSGAPESRSTETTLIEGDRVASQASGERPFAQVPAFEAAGVRASTAGWLPATAVRAALDSAASCRPGASLKVGGHDCKPITYTDAAGRPCTLIFDEERRLVRIEHPHAHQWLGDACDWTSFDGCLKQDGLEMPSGVTRFTVQASTTTRFDLKLKSARRATIPAGAALLPEARRQDIPSWGRPGSTASGLEIVPVAAGVWMVESETADARVLAVERASDLFMLGAPNGDADCAAILRALRERFPDKPVGLVAFGHHHPSPSGGLRAIAAQGATIQAPRELETHVRSHLARPATFGAPAIAAPSNAPIELFDGETTIDCLNTSVRLINIREKSAHTFQYVVFYLPESGVLFQDDLGYVPTSGATRAGRRLAGLVEALDGLDVVPTRMIQLWPVKGALREVEWSLVAGLVQAERASAEKK